MSPRSVIFALAVGLAAPISARACAGCNIHNYLAKSVLSSESIFIGKITARTDNQDDGRVIPVLNATVRCEVIRTLSGTNRPGQTIEMTEWTRPEDVGKTFIFGIISHSAWLQPNFPILPTEAEDEVRFLLKLGELQWEVQKNSGNPYATNLYDIWPETLLLYKVRDVDEAIRLAQGWSNESKEIDRDSEMFSFVKTMRQRDGKE